MIMYCLTPHCFNATSVLRYDIHAPAVHGAFLLLCHNLAEFVLQTARLLYTRIAAGYVSVCPDSICMDCTFGRRSHRHHVCCMCSRSHRGGVPSDSEELRNRGNTHCGLIIVISRWDHLTNRN